MNYTDSPDYLKAADLHNLGSGSESFFDSPLEQTGNFISKIPSFAVTSVASGINSIYNSGVVAGNFFGLTDAKENDIGQTLREYDSDLGKYYEDHKQAVDLTGFIATSFVPGIAGVKLLNYGQKALKGAITTGAIGETLAEGTGLIATATSEGKTLAQIAAQSVAESGQTFSLTNTAVLKAIAGGVGQSAIEGVAFEAMVDATMFRSPVLEGQDFKDMTHNLLTAGLLGGVVGGALSTAKTYGLVKGAIQEVDAARRPFVAREGQGFISEPSDRIVISAQDKLNTAVPTSPTEEALNAKRTQYINNDIRENTHALSVGDGELGNAVADTLVAMHPDQVSNVMYKAKAIVRAGGETKVADGHAMGYVSLHGEDAGKVVFEGFDKRNLTLADSLKDKAAVDSFVASAKFSLTKEWSPVTSGSMQEVEARYIYSKSVNYKESMKIGHDDIPLLEGALASGVQKIVIKEGTFEYEVTAANLHNEILQAKTALVEELKAGKKLAWNLNIGEGKDQAVSTITSDQIAKIANVSRSFLEESPSASMFARQDAQAAYTESRKAAGLSSGEKDLDYVPKHIGVIYDPSHLADTTSDTVGAMVNIRQQQKIAQDAVDRAVTGVMGDMGERLTPISSSEMSTAGRTGAGAGLVSFSNGGYGTLASKVEQIGKVTADLVMKLQKNTAAITDSVALRLRGNQAAAIEVDKIHNLVASTTEKYILNEAGDGLVSQKTYAYRKAIEAGEKDVKVPALQQGAPEEIKFISSDAGDVITAQIESNGSRVQHQKNLRAAQGLEDSRDPNVFQPIKPDPRDLPHFAFVKDESVTGTGMGHTSMIHAHSAKELEDMIALVNKQGNPSLKVYTKSDTEGFFKAQQSYDFDRTLHDNYMDSSLKSMGVNNQFFPKTDPNKIVDGWLESERRRDSILARETVSAKYANEFDQLETLGQSYTDAASSRYGVTQKAIESTVQNPYNDYRKTALNISRLSEYPTLTSFNRQIEDNVSKVYQKIKDTFVEARTAKDLEATNAALQEAGVNHAYKSAAEVILANHSAPPAYVSQFIRGANSILANTFLRLDPMNALNNAVGAQVLLGHETSTLLKGIRAGNSDVAGELVGLSGITVPGTDLSILSTPKLIGNAQVNYFKHLRGEVPELSAMYKDNSWLSKTTDQFKSMLDDLALGGNESPREMTTMIERALAKSKEVAGTISEKGGKWTGNNLAEEYNRFVAADVARQISDLGIKAGVMTGENQASYINTFVNRTQGNTLASQRPLIFQGPIGQAMGLFQGFQFNTMQQLFRGVAEGGAKDAAMLLGLQGTMYGMNGLPGFQYINQHIVGTASGNKDHTDAYSALYGAAGRTAGDWLMYGIPSNMLKANLYTRGDINPRNLTIIPTNPADIVAVSAFGKFAGNFVETVGKMAGGGDVVQSFLQGLEHNTLSRPLAGLAQTLQATQNPEHKVFSTTNSGDLSFTNDLLSIATLARLSGAKPLDEALANDEAARSLVYQAADKTRMKAATETFKSSTIGVEGIPEQGAVENYMEAFVRNGGRAEDFNKNMLHAMTQSNTPRANQIIQSLKTSSRSEHMKLMMGGKVADLND